MTILPSFPGRSTALSFRRDRIRAFTLMELLVVVGIISVLVAMLFPMVTKMRAAGKGVQCLGNLRTLGQISLNFANDNNGNIPQASIDKSSTPYWFEQLCVYVGQGKRGSSPKFMGCPTSVGVPGGTFSTEANNRVYDCNQRAGYSWSPASEPASHTYVKHGFLGVGNSVVTPTGGISKVAWFMCPRTDNGVFFSMSAARDIPFRRDHNKKTNVLFMDGHVTAVDIPNFKLQPSLLSQRQWIDFFGEE